MIQARYKCEQCGHLGYTMDGFVSDDGKDFCSETCLLAYREKAEVKIEMTESPTMMSLADLFGPKEDASNNIIEHYGVKEKDFADMCEDIFVEFIRSGGEKTEVIDTNFKDLDAEQRVKVLAFASAMIQYQLYQSSMSKMNRGDY